MALARSPEPVKNSPETVPSAFMVREQYAHRATFLLSFGRQVLHRI